MKFDDIVIIVVVVAGVIECLFCVDWIKFTAQFVPRKQTPLNLTSLRRFGGKNKSFPFFLSVHPFLLKHQGDTSYVCALHWHRCARVIMCFCELMNRNAFTIGIIYGETLFHTEQKSDLFRVASGGWTETLDYPHRQIVWKWKVIPFFCVILCARRSLAHFLLVSINWPPSFLANVVVFRMTCIVYLMSIILLQQYACSPSPSVSVVGCEWVKGGISRAKALGKRKHHTPICEFNKVMFMYKTVCHSFH